MNETPEKSVTSYWRERLTSVFGIDPRSLAVFRICLGSLLLVDVLRRAENFTAMYTEVGFFPLSLATSHFGDNRWSLSFLSGATEFQAAVFVLAAIFAFALLIGCWTRVATIVSWVLLVSLQARNPLVLNNGDTFMRMLLFWSIFLPLGRVWSFDAWRRPAGGDRYAPVLSVATAAVLLQICLVYWFTGMAKCNEVWLGSLWHWVQGNAAWSEVSVGGDAMHYVWSLDIYARPFARMMLEYPAVGKWLAFATVVLEILGPLLLLIPWGTRWLRLGVILSFVLFHVGIELSLDVGLFSMVSIVAWIALLPSVVWTNRFSRGIGQFVKRLCSSKRETPAASPQRTTMPAAVIRAAAQVVCLVFLLFVVAWNVSFIGETESGLRFRRSTNWLASATWTLQRWQMFGRPPTVGVWFVYRAELKNGAMVDVLRGGAAVSLEKPPSIAATFPNYAWRKMHRNILDAELASSERLAAYHQSITEFMCRQWNERHGPDEQVVALDMLCFAYSLAPAASPAESEHATLARVELGNAEETSNLADVLRAIERDDSVFPD